MVRGSNPVFVLVHKNIQIFLRASCIPVTSLGCDVNVPFRCSKLVQCFSELIDRDRGTKEDARKKEKEKYPNWDKKCSVETKNGPTDCF